jgi:hypothetical protein
MRILKKDPQACISIVMYAPIVHWTECRSSLNHLKTAKSPELVDARAAL